MSATIRDTRGSRPAHRVSRHGRGPSVLRETPRVVTSRLSTEEKRIICRALHDALYSAARGDNIGPLAEYGPPTQGVVSYDEHAVERNVRLARSALAKLTRGSWGVATITEGIIRTRRTHRQAVAELGFATGHTRERSGRLWVYTSGEGNSATVGRIADLLAAGFAFVPEAES
jgi:hypothetical protein